MSSSPEQREDQRNIDLAGYTGHAAVRVTSSLIHVRIDITDLSKNIDNVCSLVRQIWHCKQQGLG